jgi:hypothetical protein
MWSDYVVTALNPGFSLKPIHYVLDEKVVSQAGIQASK